MKSKIDTVVFVPLENVENKRKCKSFKTSFFFFLNNVLDDLRMNIGGILDTLVEIVQEMWFSTIFS